MQPPIHSAMQAPLPAMRWIVNTSTDPAFNLALEEYLLRSVQAGHFGYAILWQNRPTVVVGRFQNTQAEINADYIRQHAISVVRRMTGGGAVYHDAGTLNYTFIHHLGTDSTLPDFRASVKPVAAALRSLGLPVTFSGRNDLILDGAKVVGVAHCRLGSRFLHHGCILVDTDLDVLSQALQVDPAKFRSKGAVSVRSRVSNLAEWLARRNPASPRLTVATVRQAIMERCPGEVLALNDDAAAAVAILKDSKYASHDWTYGASPPFTEHRQRRFPWGSVEVFFDVQKGNIHSCRINGDFFITAAGNFNEERDSVKYLEDALTHIPYTQEAIISALDKLHPENLFCGCCSEELKAFLAGR